MALWRRRGWLVGIVILATAATYVWSNHRPRVYQASTKLAVRASGLSGLLNPSTAAPSDRQVVDQATLLLTRDVAQRAAKTGGLDESPDSLLASISAQPVLGADFINITTKRSSAASAAAVANAFATAYVELRKDQVRTTAQQQRVIAERELRLLGNSPTAITQRQTLQAQIRQLQLIESAPTGEIQQLDPAQPPGRPISPKPVRDAIFAFVLSALLGAALLYLLDRFDPRLRSVAEAEEVFGVPLLAVVPHGRETLLRDELGYRVGDELTEAFRSLRTSLLLAGQPRPVRSVLVTSSVPGEGKSTLVQGIALAYRESGAAVAVVDADLRRPSVTASFELERAPGLVEVLTGDATVDEVLQEIAVQTHEESELMVRARAHGAGTPAEDRPAFHVVAPGRHVDNPPAVLASPGVARMIDELTESHDLVVFDSPPMLAVSDALPLARIVDVVIVVARLDKTTKRAANRLVERIAGVGDAVLLGVVVNDVVGTESDYGYSGYRTY